MPTVNCTTASQLLARANGMSLCVGDNRCFLCGAACDNTYPRAEYVAEKSFNDWAIVASPASKFVCAGCTIGLNEAMVMPGRDKPQRFRNYSWLITSDRAEHFHKGEQTKIAAVLLDPPQTPWAMVLAVSGQRHLLYRTPVNRGGGVLSVSLETERVEYTFPTLLARAELARQLIAAIGKPALSERITPGHAIAAAEYLGDTTALEIWIRVASEPLSRLALFISQGREACRELYPAAA
jgi:CRISPR type IV-associated protein Csf1